jgi:hypothetical protein
MSEAYAIDKAFITDDLFDPESPTRTRPRVGASVLLFERVDQEDLAFIGTATVIDTAVEPVIRSVTGRTVEDLRAAPPYQLSAVTTFEEPRSLISLGGSLQRTRDFLDPATRFRSPIVPLSTQDQMTIVENEIDMGRSVFRILFHALPLEIQAAFVRDHAALYPSLTQNENYDYAVLSTALVQYLTAKLNLCFDALAMLQDAYPQEIAGIPAFNELYVGPGSEEPKVPAADSESAARTESETATSTLDTGGEVAAEQTRELASREISIGADVIRLLGFRGDNRLFQPHGEEPPLLEAVLPLVVDGQLGTRRRKWTEPIF